MTSPGHQRVSGRAGSWAHLIVKPVVQVSVRTQRIRDFVWLLSTLLQVLICSAELSFQLRWSCFPSSNKINTNSFLTSWMKPNVFPEFSLDSWRLLFPCSILARSSCFVVSGTSTVCPFGLLLLTSLCAVLTQSGSLLLWLISTSPLLWCTCVWQILGRCGETEIIYRQNLKPLSVGCWALPPLHVLGLPCSGHCLVATLSIRCQACGSAPLPSPHPVAAQPGNGHWR